MLSRIRKHIDEREEGFTLIELLVVMIIIGILAAIAIPVFLNQRNSGYDAGAKSDAKNASTAEETYFTDNNVYTDNSAATGTDNHGPLQGWTKSANTTGFRFATYTTTSANDSYKIEMKSKSGKYFCFNSQSSGAGVTGNGTTACW
jgi:type IV pilus assembly protein PilA